MSRYPTRSDLLAALDAGGYTLDLLEACPIQGVVIRWRRPARDGEHLLGMPVANPVVSEVIERHYTADLEASPQVARVTDGRAIQRALWHIDQDRSEASQ